VVKRFYAIIEADDAETVVTAFNLAPVSTAVTVKGVEKLAAYVATKFPVAMVNALVKVNTSALPK
jgi:hypothetical protein